MVLGKQTKLKGLYYTLMITFIIVIAFFITVTSIQYLWRGVSLELHPCDLI